MPRQNNIQIRKGSGSDWDSANPVLASGEPGFETDSNRLKIGANLNWDDTNYISADSLLTTVYNNTATTISKFNVVYINGGQGNKPTIALSIANSEMTSSRTYGVTVNNIPNNSSGLVIVNGALKNLNTNIFGLDKEGSSLWLSPTVSGGLTLTKPYAPDNSVFVGTIIRSHNTQGIVEVKIQNGYELEELHNVATTGTTNGQFLQYNSTSGLWVPSSSGNFTSLSVNGTGVISSTGGTTNYISKFTGNSTIANSLVFDNGTNVGIGLTNPVEKLDVSGNIKVAGANTSLTIAQDDTTTMRMRSAGNLIVAAGSAANVRFLISTTEHARLSDQGRFGIGLAAPSGKLGVAGGVTVGTNYNVTPPTNGMIVEGNVGIGTTTPGYKLQVAGSFGATTKSFRIDHPSKSGWNLEYGSLESPYHGVRLTGRGKVIKGVGAVSLPVYLKDLIHDDDTLNIQITNIKHGKTIYIDKIDLKNDRFIVKADRSKTLGELEFFWTLSGVRKDVDHLVVEKRN